MSLKYHMTIFSTTTLLMLGIYTVFVGFFFFTYGAYIEKKVVKNQIDILINNFSDDFKFFASQSQNGKKLIQIINSNINKISIPDLSKLDAQVKTKNKSLIKTSVITLVVTFLIFIILSVCVWYFGLSSKQKEENSYVSIIQRLLLIMFIVMLIEFFFFTLVVGNYRPVNPNDVKKYFVESLEKYSKS